MKDPIEAQFPLLKTQLLLWIAALALMGCAAPDIDSLPTTSPPPATPSPVPPPLTDTPAPYEEPGMSFNCWAAFIVPVRGRVIDAATDEPISEATVTIESYDRDAMRLYICPKIYTPLTTMTDDDGEFFFETVIIDGVNNGLATTTVQVSKPGCEDFKDTIQTEHFAPAPASGIDSTLYITCRAEATP